MVRCNGVGVNSRGRCAFVAIAPHPRITRDKRKIARLAIFPNFLRYAPKTSFIPNVIFNRRVDLLKGGFRLNPIGH